MDATGGPQGASPVEPQMAPPRLGGLLPHEVAAVPPAAPPLPTPPQLQPPRSSSSSSEPPASTAAVPSPPQQSSPAPADSDPAGPHVPPTLGQYGRKLASPTAAAAAKAAATPGGSEINPAAAVAGQPEPAAGQDAPPQQPVEGAPLSPAFEMLVVMHDVWQTSWYRRGRRSAGYLQRSCSGTVSQWHGF